ncbi:MAG: NAD(P)/FAD-dependent oxidoreductase [Calditrichaeota bacterium]|nr:MAG: NAD(P)/FAD-dependent oxidoreductase [Calditrichota bacterium]
MNDKRVHIIGAGPAGLVAAINLARAKYEVIVHEQKKDVGGRFKGEYQGLENWSSDEDALDFLNRIGVFLNFCCEPIRETHFCDPFHSVVSVKTKRPLFYLVERGTMEWTLDQGLKRQALAEGVEFHWEEKIETLPSGWVIVATGPKAADAIAKGMVFHTSHPNICVGFLDNRIAPKAYAYLLINNYRGTFATCLFEDFPNEKKYFVRALETAQKLFPFDVQAPQEFGGYINFFLEFSMVRHGRVLYVGETAGFQDALWGFGLRYAMLSGYLAAVSIRTGLFYDDLCRQYIRPFMETSLANRWLFAHLGNRGYRYFLKKMAQSPNVIAELKKNYQPSLLKEMIFQVARKNYRTRLINKQCMHQNCNCVWCRHCREETELSTVG